MHENHANSPILICCCRSKALQRDASLGRLSYFSQLKPLVLLSGRLAAKRICRAERSRR